MNAIQTFQSKQWELVFPMSAAVVALVMLAMPEAQASDTTHHLYLKSKHDAIMHVGQVNAWINFVSAL